MELQEIILKYKDNLSKQEMFDFLYQLKYNIEMNSSVDGLELFQTVNLVYNDTTPLYQGGFYTPEQINELKEDEVFVFGSNDLGEHKGGAARVAHEKFGAIYGQACGLQGQSYGIRTVRFGDFEVTLDTILAEIIELVSFAEQNTDKIFYVTKIGTGIGPYSVNDIASLFDNMILPPNLILPIEFVYKTMRGNYFYNSKQDIYIAINDTRTKITYIDMKQEKMYSKPYAQFIGHLSSNDYEVSSFDVYKVAFNKLIKNIHE